MLLLNYSERNRASGQGRGWRFAVNVKSCTRYHGDSLQRPQHSNIHALPVMRQSWTPLFGYKGLHQAVIPILNFLWRANASFYGALPIQEVRYIFCLAVLPTIFTIFQVETVPFPGRRPLNANSSSCFSCAAVGCESWLIMSVCWGAVQTLSCTIR